jgi:hypothetical protein
MISGKAVVGTLSKPTGLPTHMHPRSQHRSLCLKAPTNSNHNTPNTKTLIYPSLLIRNIEMMRSPLATIQGKSISPKKMQKTIGVSSCRENAPPNRSPKRTAIVLQKPTNSKENTCRRSKNLVADTSDAQMSRDLFKSENSNLTPRIAMLEADTSNLLSRLQASYKTSRDILQEIYREKADILDFSPMKTVCSDDGESKEYEDVSLYCEGKQFSSTGGVEIDSYQEVSSYCVDKMLLLSTAAELDAIKKERTDLLLENDDLRQQIQFKSACCIQAESSIASLIKLVKEKEAAIEEYDVFLRLNDQSNAKIMKAMEVEQMRQLAALNEKLESSSNEIHELETRLEAMESSWSHYKGMCKLKNRQLESAVETAANLERTENENSDLQVLVKNQSSRIDYLTKLNDEINEVLASLTMMLHEKEGAIGDWVNFSKMNEVASKKLFEHIGKKHQEELQHNDEMISGLLGIIKRQKFGESEYLQVQLKEKTNLQMEVDAMKQRLDAYDLDDQRLTDTHVILAVITLSSGILLLFWSYIVSDITNCL